MFVQLRGKRDCMCASHLLSEIAHSSAESAPGLINVGGASICFSELSSWNWEPSLNTKPKSTLASVQAGAEFSGNMHPYRGFPSISYANQPPTIALKLRSPNLHAVNKAAMDVKSTKQALDGIQVTAVASLKKVASKQLHPLAALRFHR